MRIFTRRIGTGGELAPIFCRHCGASLAGRSGAGIACPRCGEPVTDPGRGTPPPRLGFRYADGILRSEDGRDLPPHDTQPDRVIDLPYRTTDVRLRIGPYEVLDELGRGGMGVVYRAYSLRLRRTCAIKVLTGGEHQTEADIERFQNEAMLAARLTHPNIVQVFDAGESQGLFYFVMEYVQGRGIEHLAEAGEIRAGVEALAKAARALDHAHRRGVVHRDVKPDNILVDASGEPHVTDFGIAKALGQDSGLTWAGRPIGTPNYMPPEQANGELDAIGPLSDVYSLGATLYHLLAGRPPFVGDAPLQVLMEVLEKEPEAPGVVARRERGREVPLDLEAICLKAMEKRARRRYPSAAAMATDLEAWLAQRPVAARPLGRTERLRKTLSSNRAALVGGLVVASVLLLLTAAFGALVLFGMRRTGDSLRQMGREAGLQQAATLERAIRTAMQEERPEVARDLVRRLRQDPELAALDVVRPDRTLAYEDAARGAPRFDFDEEAWRDLVTSGRLEVREERVDGEPVLTVLRPIVNQPECQACHKTPGAPPVLGVLVVRRSLRPVEARLAENRADTLAVGGVTAAAFLTLLAIFTRLFGIGLPRRRFGDRARGLEGSWVDPEGRA